jgi:hypothetical protein
MSKKEKKIKQKKNMLHTLVLFDETGTKTSDEKFWEPLTSNARNVIVYGPEEKKSTGLLSRLKDVSQRIINGKELNKDIEKERKKLLAGTGMTRYVIDEDFWKSLPEPAALEKVDDKERIAGRSDMCLLVDTDYVKSTREAYVVKDYLNKQIKHDMTGRSSHVWLASRDKMTGRASDVMTAPQHMVNRLMSVVPRSIICLTEDPWSPASLMRRRTSRLPCNQATKM